MTHIRTRLFSVALPFLLADMGPKCGSSNQRERVPPPPPTESAPDATPSTPDAGH